MRDLYRFCKKSICKKGVIFVCGLTNEQLVARIQAGENKTENMLQLWQQNKGHIANVARKFSKYAEMEDLEQEGYIALYNAVQGYKIEQGMSFINYATFYMRRQFERCANNNRAVPLPFGASDSVYKYKKIFAQFLKRYGREPIDQEMQLLLGAGEKEFNSIKKAVRSSNTESMNKPITGEDEELTLGDTIASPQSLEDECIDRIDREALGRELWLAVDELPEDQNKAIKKKFIDKMTLNEIGELEGMNRNAIHKKISNAVFKLRYGRHAKTLRRYYDIFFPAVSSVHVGARQFQQTWTSGTELAAMRNYERSRSVDTDLEAISKEADR